MGKGRLLRNRNVGDIVMNAGKIYGYDSAVYIDFGTDGKIILTADSAVEIPGDFTVTGNFTFGDAATDELTVKGKLEYWDEIVHKYAVVQTKSANYTMTEADVGKITYVDTDGVVITLPATVVGMEFTIVNAGADGTVGVSISPNAADKIMGIGLTSADDKDLINTKATARKGDMVKLIGDGVNGWYVTACNGTWDRET